MRLKHPALAAILTISMGSATLTRAVDLSFLDQAPLRFLTDADMHLLDTTIGQVLEKAKDGESRHWQGKESGNSGTVTAMKSFELEGEPCRRIKIVTFSPSAVRGGGEALVDLCKIEGKWKILRMPE